MASQPVGCRGCLTIGHGVWKQAHGHGPIPRTTVHTTQRPGSTATGYSAIFTPPTSHFSQIHHNSTTAFISVYHKSQGHAITIPAAALPSAQGRSLSTTLIVHHVHNSFSQLLRLMPRARIFSVLTRRTHRKQAHVTYIVALASGS